MTDFFDKKTETPEPPSSVKVGEKEYTQDELSQLVGLGESAREYETKWNRKIGEFYPDYTRKSQRLAELEKADEDRSRLEEEEKQKALNEKAKGGTDNLSPEEVRQVALKQARELGIVTTDVFDTRVKKAIADAFAGSKLIDDVSAVLSGAEEKGQPKSTVEDLLRYMDETGVKNPEKAYKLKFEDELDKWKEDKLKGIKPRGMETQIGSTAGSKAPPPPQLITRDNLAQAIRESLTRSRGV